MHPLVPVYDFANTRPGGPALFLLAGAAFFAIFWLIGHRFNDRKALVLGRWAPLILVVVAVVAFAFDFSEWRGVRAIYEAGRYRVVEGAIGRYATEPASGRTPLTESAVTFEVSGVPFRAESGDGSYGYHKMPSEDGVLTDGRYVRISYYHDGKRNVILKLEAEGTALKR